MNLSTETQVKPLAQEQGIPDPSTPLARNSPAGIGSPRLQSRDEPDDLLVQRTLKGDRDAFAQLYRRYEKPLFNFIFQYVGDYEAAQDIFQETFIRIYRKLHRYRLGTNFSAWIHRIAINQSKDEFKRKKRRPVSNIAQIDDGEEADAFATLADEAPTPYRLLEDRETAQRVRQALTRLSREHMEVILLYVFQGMPYKEIAETLSVPIGTVKSRMHYAVKELGKVVEGRI